MSGARGTSCPYARLEGVERHGVRAWRCAATGMRFAEAIPGIILCTMHGRWAKCRHLRREALERRGRPSTYGHPLRVRMGVS